MNKKFVSWEMVHVFKSFMRILFSFLDRNSENWWTQYFLNLKKLLHSLQKTFSMSVFYLTFRINVLRWTNCNSKIIQTYHNVSQIFWYHDLSFLYLDFICSLKAMILAYLFLWLPISTLQRRQGLIGWLIVDRLLSRVFYYSFLSNLSF